MLKLQDVTKSFPSVFEPVLKNLSFELESGDFAVLIGSNGSGKTTLLKTISGEYSPDSGHIFLGPQNMTKMPLHRRAKLISSVSQDPNRGTIQEMSVLENLVLAQMRGRRALFKSYGRHTYDIKEKISALGLGLNHALSTPLSALSGGQRQIIATIMATLSNPKILLLDEHSSALDPKTQEVLMNYTDQIIRDHHITALMITHNLRDALKFGNRLIMLNQGHIVLDLKEPQKRLLSLQDLLDMFQNYEKNTLLQKD